MSDVVPPSLTAVTVKPALVLPRPVVITERVLNLAANFKNWDLPVPEIQFEQNIVAIFPFLF